MEISQVKDVKSLRVWLSNKSKECSQVIALRAALRALPFISISSELWLKNFALLPFGAIITSWMQLSDESFFVLTDESRANARFGGHSFDFDGYKAEHIAALAADASYHSADAQSKSLHTLNDCVFAVKSAARAFREDFQNSFPDDHNLKPAGDEGFWFSVERDCNWLASLNRMDSANILNLSELWLNGAAVKWAQDWSNCKAKLLSIDPNYSVWIDWYERRIRGERAAFDIPGDKGRIEDKKILRSLAEATDEDFWGKGHEYVNATLKGWLDEARARVAPLQPIIAGASGTFDITGDASGTVRDPINPDPQDVRSPQFGVDPTGRIAINADAGADQLRSDVQSLSRHARALLMAQKLGESLLNHNNAGYMTEMASNYFAAMEGGPNGPDPSGLVFAGDQLREAVAKHRAAGAEDDLQPLPPSADRDASAFLSAHNMYVGSDPFLDDLDRTTRGPDAPLPVVNPDEIRRVANVARDDDILAEPTYDYMIAASEAAPPAYDSADRHSRFAAGLAQNFARYGIELLWAYPNETAWASLAAGAVVTVALGPLAAVGGTIGGIGIAYHMARNMIANEAIYEKLLATSPAGEDNFNRLMRFLKSLPIKSLKDD